MITENSIFITAGNMAGNITSSALPLATMYGFSMQVVMTGVLTGTLKLQASDDFGNSNSAIDGTGITTWADISGTSQAITNTTTSLYNLGDVYYRWVRLVYTAATGAGTMVATFNAKGD